MAGGGTGPEAKWRHRAVASWAPVGCGERFEADEPPGAARAAQNAERAQGGVIVGRDGVKVAETGVRGARGGPATKASPPLGGHRWSGVHRHAVEPVHHRLDEATSGFGKSPLFPRADGEAITGNALGQA